MYKLISYWTAPSAERQDEFEREYQDTHIPLALACPGVRRAALTRTPDGLGGPPAFYRAVEIEWDDRDAFEASTASPQWAALVEDTVRMIETYGVSTQGALGTPEVHDPSPGMAPVDEILTTTRAVRRRLDLDREVDPEVLKECIELALQAPVGAGRAGPHFVVVTDAAKKKVIADHYRDHGRGLLAAGVEGAEDEEARKVMESALYLADILERVPVLVIPCVQGRWDTSTHADQSSSFGSVLPATWSLQLALRSRGLGSAWTTIHLYRKDEIAELLGLPADVTQAALLPVAHTTGGRFKPASRPPVDDVLHWNSWD
ncbi:MAG: EthD family reductase [Actinobacteria bacterium]|nr:EthD family reductase [Actinomycetota bacterium]